MSNLTDDQIAAALVLCDEAKRTLGSQRQWEIAARTGYPAALLVLQAARAEIKARDTVIAEQTQRITRLERLVKDINSGIGSGMRQREPS